MGVQLLIQTQDLETAGWSISYDEYEIYVGDTPEGDPIWEPHRDLIIRKGAHEFRSYLDSAFMADCNTWGPNRALFEQAGLLELPHEMV